MRGAGRRCRLLTPGLTPPPGPGFAVRYRCAGPGQPQPEGGPGPGQQQLLPTADDGSSGTPCSRTAGHPWATTSAPPPAARPVTPARRPLRWWADRSWDCAQWASQRNRSISGPRAPGDPPGPVSAEGTRAIHPCRAGAAMVSGPWSGREKRGSRSSTGADLPSPTGAPSGPRRARRSSVGRRPRPVPGPADGAPGLRSGAPPPAPLLVGRGNGLGAPSAGHSGLGDTSLEGTDDRAELAGCEEPGPERT